MPNSRVFTLATVAAIALSACATSPDPASIVAEPIYDKYGDFAGCTDGYVAGANDICVPPPGECSAAAGGPDCLPDYDQGGGDAGGASAAGAGSSATT